MSGIRRHSLSQREQSMGGEQLLRRRERSSAIAKRSRGRTGCLNCRRRKKKCDESKPACAKCDSRGETCEWDSGLTFRLSGIDADHASMVQSRAYNTNSQSCYQIVNVTFDTENALSKRTEHEKQNSTCQDPVSPSNETYNKSEDGTPHDRQFLEPVSTGNEVFPSQIFPRKAVVSHARSSSDSTESSSQARFANDHLVSAQTVRLSSMRGDRNGIADQDSIDTSNYPLSKAATVTANSVVDAPALPQAIGISTESRHSDGLNISKIARPQPKVTSAELEALDYLTSHEVNAGLFPSAVQSGGSLSWDPNSTSDFMRSPVANNSIVAESPDMYATCYPNATYEDLHTTLYHHMMETARTTALTRQASPDPFARELSSIDHNASCSTSIDSLRAQLQVPGRQAQPLKSTKLLKRRQLELWCNYLDEIAIWLDMFDSERHFQIKIPLLAKSADHLHYSILALSARQIERRDPEKPYTESLGLYQEAIKLIVQELHTLDTAVIASCVLLCVLEMMSSSPRAWGRHLNGCAMLLEAAGVNGVIGGLRQSLFWCFARMDVWGGFLGDTLTKIPTNRWFIPSGSMNDAVSHFKAGSGGDSYANYAVFLCASVVNVISNKTPSSAGQDEVESARKTSYLARWKALFDLLEDWYNNRPEEMQPLMSYPSSVEERSHPFPIVLYSTSTAINGNQLYHAAALLMLQDKPKDIRLTKSSKSIFWHARQICGIAASNSNHGPWINALQPLWIAGKVMSHETEHQAILYILARIERETGWATSWRAQDLRDYWGDADCSEM